ncbi:MAG: 3-keto-disaccharide hydrolase [Roseibacillus sp.]
MRNLLFILLSFLTLSFGLLCAQPSNEALEPKVEGADVITLIEGGTFEGWRVPSDRWSITGGVITGDTQGEKLKEPEWIFTQQSFGDFILTVEVRLSGGPRGNSGLYFRAQPITFQRGKHGPFEAPSGYEFDIAKDHNNGTLGDWYARPSLRIKPDSNLMKDIYRAEDWNRLTIRARGPRFEYWLNGRKIMDFTDPDPKGSREGLIALQIHDRLAMKIELRNATLLALTKSE